MPTSRTPPSIPSPTSSRKQAEGAVLTSSLVVLAIWTYRKLIEPGTIGRTTEPTLRKIIGAEPAPASSAQFAVGFGFVFFTLSIAAVAAPELATGFAILIAVGYTLTNGASVFADVSRQVSAKTAGAGAAPTSGGMTAAPARSAPAPASKGTAK